MERVREWEPCSGLRAGQGAVVLQGLGGGRAQGTSLHIPSLGRPQHGAATIMVQESSSSSTFADVGWKPTTTTQKRPLPCFPLQLCLGSPQPHSCGLPWEGSTCSPSRIHLQMSITHPHLTKSPLMSTAVLTAGGQKLHQI